MEHSDTNMLKRKTKKELIDIILEVDFENYLLRKEMKKIAIGNDEKNKYNKYIEKNKQIIIKLREEGYKI